MTVDRSPGVVADIPDFLAGIRPDIDKDSGAGAKIRIGASLRHLMAENLWNRVAAGQRPIIADPRVIAADAIVAKELMLTDEAGIPGRMAGRHVVERVGGVVCCADCSRGDQLV